jgi:HSP20 family protein
MRLVHYSYPSFRTLAPSLAGCTRLPWSGLESEINRLFENALSGFGSPAPSHFAVDLFEDKANTYVRAALPGLNRDNINVEMTDGYLTIAATRQIPAASKGTAPTGDAEAEESFSFSRAISIADDVQTDKVTAGYENGVLTVTLPKRETAQPKKITVTVK